MSTIPRNSLAAALTFCCALGAQMSGTYTVDRLGTGPRNFKSLNAAGYDLAALGVSGPRWAAYPPQRAAC